jgi:hypothetical protein
MNLHGKGAVTGAGRGLSPARARALGAGDAVAPQGR